MSDFGNILLVAFGIGLLIYVHELGHYLAARLIGVRVEVFSLGFGPRVCGFRRGPTDYRLSLIPLGGYVAVAGMEPGDHRYPPSTSLHGKTVGQRMFFYAGGVAMNLLFALVAFPIAFGSGVAFTAPEVGTVAEASAAWEAGLEEGDRVLSVGGKPMYSFENMAVEIALSGGREVPLRVQRGEAQLDLTVRPQYRAAEGLYVLGVGQPLARKPIELSVVPGGAAAAAGVQEGDLLLAVNGRPTSAGSWTALEPLLTGTDEREPVQLHVRRGTAERNLEVRPERAADERPALLGVEPLRDTVSALRPGLPALAALDLQRGDVLLAVDGVPFRGLEHLAQSDEPRLTMLVGRGGGRRELVATVRPGERERLAGHIGLVADPGSTRLSPVAGGAAEAAGIETGDRLLALEGEPVADWPDLQQRVRAAGERPLAVRVERAGPTVDAPPATLEFTITPRPPEVYDLGLRPAIEPHTVEVRAGGFADAVRLGCVCSVDLIKQLYVTMKRLLTGDVAAKNLGGIITISRVSYREVQWGLSRFLYFLALLSINLAFINVLPIPVLDGGHLVFLLIERIKGSPVSTRVLTYSQVLGLVFVLALVVFVTYNDILRLL